MIIFNSEVERLFLNIIDIDGHPPVDYQGFMTQFLIGESFWLEQLNYAAARSMWTCLDCQNNIEARCSGLHVQNVTSNF